MKSAVHNAEGILKILGLTLLVVGWAHTHPATYDKYLGLENDALYDAPLVESLRREVRQPASLDYPGEVRDLLGTGNDVERLGKKKLIKNESGKSDEGGFFKTYGSDADGMKGYVKETFGKGDHGYKNLDTFHKQDGDNYGFEKHTSFGDGKAGEKGRHEKRGAYSKKEGDHEGSGTIVESHYADDGDYGYSEGGDGDHDSEGDSGSYEGGSGEAEAGSYGSSEGYSESSSAGEGQRESEGGYSEGEDDGGYYEGDY
ncbi:interleukin enhancer-binding factor 3-like [Belonocnema kinseyi]|uniref:interleukin enhancer-binding factor 3-like n=1 Tax=Belonocnema kinseyi TaxID=2817044 RepID=UPI00143CE4B7|nr:interleukin enhancer-binding factor 3-like [Belonocnema kinseyi]